MGASRPAVTPELRSEASMNELLQFEKEKCQDLRRFPMHFRLKLDVCGIKLSKRDWHSFDPAEKTRLLVMPCDTPEQIAVFRERLLAMIGACGGDSIEIQPISPLNAAQSPWRDKAVVPDAVRLHVKALVNDAVNFSRWPELTDLQRFTLIKLTEPGKLKPELRQVLKEFALLPDDGRA